MNGELHGGGIKKVGGSCSIDMGAGIDGHKL